MAVFSMGFFSTLIAGGLGFAWGGPIGAIVGVALAAIFNQTERAIERANQSTTQNTTRATEGDFKVSLLVLMARVMQADGHVLKSELDVVKRFLVANFGEQGAIEALQMLRVILNQSIDETEVAMQVNRHMNYSTKLELVHLLLDIANADGTISESEQAVIQRIAYIFSITEADYRSLVALYSKHMDADWAYKMLEITPEATDEELKKAYRRMAMKFHPDKVISAGEDAKRSATEKFRAINEAYEHIKQQRGIK